MMKIQGNLRHHRSTLSLETVPDGQGRVSFPGVILLGESMLWTSTVSSWDKICFQGGIYGASLSNGWRVLTSGSTPPSRGSHDPSSGPLNTKLILFTTALCYKLHDPTTFPGRFRFPPGLPLLLQGVLLIAHKCRCSLPNPGILPQPSICPLIMSLFFTSFAKFPLTFLGPITNFLPL